MPLSYLQRHFNGDITVIVDFCPLSAPQLSPAPLKRRHIYININTLTNHYNKKKHSPIGSARTTQIQQFFRVRALNGSRTRTPGLEDLYAAFASPERLLIIVGMTGLEPASDGLKARCITVLLHTRMSSPLSSPIERMRHEVHRWIRTIHVRSCSPDWSQTVRT